MDIEKLLKRFDEDFSRMGAFNHHGLVIRYAMLDEYQREAVKQFLRKHLSEEIKCSEGVSFIGEIEK